MINSNAIKSGLDKVYRNEDVVNELPTIDISKENQKRYIIFSDQHRGARNGADDFNSSEQAYNAALAYYNEMGYDLIALGDVEEMWEETTEAVLEAYKHTLSLERAFHENGRYHRVFGNHDEIWQQPQNVQKYLQPHFGDRPLNVFEGLTIPVVDNGKKAGAFFLVHGHQGTADSDKFAWFSKPFVRHVWQRFQRLTKFRLNTPAKDWELRRGHNQAMYQWAQAHKHNVALITGHTHKPVFESETTEQQLLAQKKAVAEDGTLSPTEKRKQLAALAAKIERLRTVEEADASVIANMLPCYFNTGCCSFADGSVTGLEIADNKIKLIRWSSNAAGFEPEVLDETPLPTVFAKIATRKRSRPEPRRQATPQGSLLPQPELANI